MGAAQIRYYANAHALPSSLQPLPRASQVRHELIVSTLTFNGHHLADLAMFSLGEFGTPLAVNVGFLARSEPNDSQQPHETSDVPRPVA